jgi:hypothetical protein
MSPFDKLSSRIHKEPRHPASWLRHLRRTSMVSTRERRAPLTSLNVSNKLDLFLLRPVTYLEDIISPNLTCLVSR